MASAVVIVAGVVGGKLSGAINIGLVVFAVLLVAGMALTYLAEGPLDTRAHGQTADK